MGSGSSVPAFQLTTEEAAGVDAFVAAGVAEVPSLARRVEELQAGAQESERLIEGVAQEQLQEEVRSLRRRVEELQEEVAQLKEEAGAEEAERLLDEAQTQLLEEAAVETALAQVAGRRVEELQAGSHDSEKLQEEVRSLRQAEAAAARRIEELERLREVCSLHQAETAATQRIQELDSYLREEAKGVEQVLGSAGGGTSSSAELATEAKRERNEVIVRIKARWESQKLKHILEIQEQQFGKEDRDTLNTKIDLAAALQLQNDFTGAQKQLEEVFEALGRAQSADLKPQLEEVSEALGRAGPTDLKDELHGCCETSACAHPTTRKDDPITRRAVDCFASLLGCLHEDKETMLKEVSKMQSQKLLEEHPLTVNSKADLAVVLQERDEQKEAAQVLKEILQEPHGHDVGIDFLKDLTLSPGPAAAAKDSAIDDKKKFTLHFVAKERAHANTEETSDIKYEGKIRSGASACWISFPGKFAAGWDALVAELHGDSVACVFLSTPDSGLGWHHKFADGSCYRKHIYGERDFETFGYLVKMKDRDSEKLKREQAKAKLTHAVVVAADATDKEEEKCRQEAERRWKENGKTAAWGCQWFHAWKEKVHEAVEKKQTLRVVFFPGQKGQGKLTFPELKYRNLWDSIGCGGSQKCEIAYVEHMRAQFGSAWEYEEIDVARFLQKEFPMHSIVDAKHGNRWRTGVLLKTVPSFDDDVVTRSAELKWIVKCKETQQIFVSRHIRHATEAIYNLMDNGGHDALKKALQSAIPKNIQAELPFRSRLPRGTPSIAFNVKAEEIETVQVLRDKVLSGELNLNMRQSLAQDPHASADIEVDQSEFLEAYERSLQRLSKLTDHQQEKLAELKEPNQDLHPTAPAGGGKTFVAAKYVLERLQRNPKGLVLYVCPCISLGLYFLRWLARWHAAETKESTRAATETLMERVVMLEKPYEKFILLNIQGDQIVQTPAAPVSQSVTTNQKLEFMLAVFDEGHEVLRHRNILDGISSQTTLLLSDTSQSSETSQRFPSIKRVALTQVVRSTKRIVRGAAAFQLSDEGQHTTSLGTDGPPLKCFIFKSDAEITPGGFKHEYVEFIMKAFWHVAQTFSSLRSFNNRIALLVPDDSFVKKLKVPLQEELDHSFRQRNLRLFSFNESLSFLPTEFPEAKDEVIILDTVDRSRGHEAFIVICIGLDEAIEGQGAEVDLATRAQLYVGISRAQFMAIVVNCHVPGGWLEFLTKLEFKESKFEETSGRAEIRTNAAAETLKVSAVPNSWQTTASESAHGADESKHDEDTKPKHGQVQDFPERTELKVLKSSVWDTMIDSEIASQIHHLRFDPRAEAKPPPEADAKEDAAQAEADAKEDAAQAKADEAEAAKCGNNIIMAARLGHLGGIRHLLRTVPGAVAKKSSGLNVTALHGAVYHGHAEICRVLLAAGAEVDAREIEGETPLHLAAYYGRAEVVKLLVEAKASVTVKDNKGNTPLDDARRKGHDEIVTMLERAA